MTQIPHPDAAFTETMQIGIVVPDLEAAVRTWREVYGIGNWQFMDVGPEDGKDVLLHGEPVQWRSRMASTMIGGVMWELIQPLDDNDLFGRFLAERGGKGGVHHVAVRTPNFRKVADEHIAHGHKPILSGTFSGIEINFLDTEEELGVILEIFSGMPSEQTG